jgi:type IV pilus assembly protein PilE
MRSVPVPAPRGFTLIELMITVLVIGILAAIAVPAYNDSMRKSRRSDAMTGLAAVQQAQERWRGNNSSYSTSFSDLGVAETTPASYYTLSISAAGEGENALANGYVATAIANTGTTQADDAQCARMSVRMQGGNLAYAGCGDCSDFSYTETHACFAR